MTLFGLTTIAVVCLASATPALAQEVGQQDGTAATPVPPVAKPVKEAAGPTISFSLSGATDYVFRGVSQTENDPAVFAAVRASYGGFYVGAGTENVDFPGIKQEYDLSAGYVLPLGAATSLDLGVIRYGYVDSPVDIDTVDFKAALSSTIGRTGVGVAAYWTPDYFGTDDDGFYAEVNARQPLTDQLSVSGAVGHQSIDAAGDFLTWNVGASYAVLPGATVGVRYHDTDTGRFGDRSKGRVVGSFGLSF